ncbi:MAG: sigma 54-interacting transcriptional regulator [Clostridia bacterium]|nr:sigma 54-interacting transcriptional regulator [Clostridia bacterium]
MSSNMDYKEFRRIIDNLYDEVIVYDNNYKIVYVNKACERHYGIAQEKMIGSSFFDYADEYWDLSVLPYVYKKKEGIKQRQSTTMGAEIYTIAIPLFDKNGEIQYVAMSVRDNINESGIQDLFQVKSDLLNSKISFNSKYFYKSEIMNDVMNVANMLLKVDSPCLIQGESGVGKTMLGKYIHEHSSRSKNPFVHLNCAAISKELIESELFGYTKGSFTGALSSGKKGFIEAANDGTLFLDEISELPYKVQAKLLQFIQEKKFYPVGSNTSIDVDIKIITATNRDLKKMVEMGNFREDLYYRLNVFEIEIPPLRKRKDDILVLCNYYLNQYDIKYEKDHRFSEEVKEIFLNYSWKGNIRELSNIIERLVVLVNEVIIKPWHLPKHVYDIREKKDDILDTFKMTSYDKAIESFEKMLLQKAYNECKTTRKIAEKLEISQSKASRLMRKYEIGKGLSYK